jgi:hypothetical protein
MIQGGEPGLMKVAVDLASGADDRDVHRMLVSVNEVDDSQASYPKGTPPERDAVRWSPLLAIAQDWVSGASHAGVESEVE